jgi:hypothetical protein
MSSIGELTSTPKNETISQLTDQDRIDTAFEELRRRGYTTFKETCCPSCGWRDVERSGGDPDRAVHYNAQNMDDAFGEQYLPPEWQARVDAAEAAGETDKADDIYIEAGDEGAWLRPTTLVDTLWLLWSGSAKEIVTVLRSQGLNAAWNGDPDIAIEIGAGGIPA